MPRARRLWQCVLLTVLALAPAASVSAADDLVCPQTIVVESHVTAVPPSWEVRTGDTAGELMSVTFYDGPPSEGASLVYDRESKEEKAWIAIWKLAPNEGRGYWMACAYTNTNATLSRKLRDETAECRVKYDREVTIGGLPTVKEIHCR